VVFDGRSKVMALATCRRPARRARLTLGRASSGSPAGTDPSVACITSVRVDMPLEPTKHSLA
jgi:hypothetical protein